MTSIPTGGMLVNSIYEFVRYLSSLCPLYSVQITGGGDARNFEPIVRLSYSNVDKIIRKLRRMYREKPALFDISTFAQKIY